MAGERAIVLTTRSLERLGLLRDLFEGLLERLHELRHRLLLLLELARGEVEERLVVPVQGLGRECAETRRELGVLAPEEEPGAACSEDQSDDESDDHLGRRTLEIGSDGTGTDH